MYCEKLTCNSFTINSAQLRFFYKAKYARLKNRGCLKDFVSSSAPDRHQAHNLNISRRKGNQTKKFGQLIEYNMRKIFLEKSYTLCGGETIP